jgi:hypothetical protein
MSAHPACGGPEIFGLEEGHLQSRCSGFSVARAGI